MVVLLTLPALSLAWPSATPWPSFSLLLILLPMCLVLSSCLILMSLFCSSSTYTHHACHLLCSPSTCVIISHLSPFLLLTHLNLPIPLCPTPLLRGGGTTEKRTGRQTDRQERKEGRQDRRRRDRHCMAHFPPWAGLCWLQHMPCKTTHCGACVKT